MSNPPGVIRKLDEFVVNRIAAGEVIQRPSNALKELIENSLDAGAKNILIQTKSGGMKLLQIQDDGCGIRKEDLGIVCERFTTSKLQTFEDLLSIQTYGFRGEALASISHVARLSILTKTEDSVCAYRAEYLNGKLAENGTANPQARAGNQGTTIIAEDLFYNIESRRRSMKNPAEENNKIFDVVTRYSIHNSTVGFSLKRYGESNNDFRTPPNSTVLDNIRVLFGNPVARELVPVSCGSVSSQFKMKGYVSNGNYSVKKPSFILFINNRLVESTGLKKVVDGIYSTYLPKGSHPFVYLSLELEPRNVDVNVHPTKHEVHFLHEDIIIAEIGNSIDTTLQASNQSRTFYIQSLLPGAGTLVKTNEEYKKAKMGSENVSTSTIRKDKGNTQIAPKNLVRTDPRAQTLDRFLATPKPNTTASLTTEIGSAASTSSTVSSINSLNSHSSGTRTIQLDSVRTLWERVQMECHGELMTAFRNHTFVGCVDRTNALIQYDTKLYMVNTVMKSKELFYQKMVSNFGNISCLQFDDPVPVRKLVTVALKENGDVASEVIEETAADISTFLESKAPMLRDYFSLRIDGAGNLQGIPLLLDNYIPCVELIPYYILNLAKRVNWGSETECFRTFCQETAQFYAILPGNDEENEEKLLTGHTWKWTIEHVIYPEFKKSLLPQKCSAGDSTVIELADLPSLYKVFERC